MSKGSGKCPVYTVEARMKGERAAPAEVNGMILDGEWRGVSFSRVPDGLGVPNTSVCRLAAEGGFFSYEAAMALAWWFIAGAAWRSVELRLVEYDFTYSYSAEQRATSEPFCHPIGRIESGQGQPTP